MELKSKRIIEEWHTKQIGDVALKVGSGITPKGGERVYKPTGRLFIRSQNIGWGILQLEDVAFIDELTHQTFVSTEINKDDVLLNITGASIGRCALATAKIEGGNVNQHVCIIRTEQSQLDPALLSYLMLSEQGWRQIESFQAGGNRQGLNFAQIRSFEFFIPKSIQEQTAIATALSDTDALINSLEKLIAKKRDIKQGVMQELLKPKKGWEVKKLGEICDVRDGTHESPKYYDSGVLFITSKNITNNRIDFTDVSYISEEDALQINQRSNVEKGDILMSMIGTIGNAALINFDPNFCIKNVALFKPKRVSGEFLIQLINSTSFKRYLEGKLDGGIQKFISLSVLRELAIKLPSLPEQKESASVLYDMDLEINTLESKLEKYRQIKSGMMQNLLTGKIRLV